MRLISTGHFATARSASPTAGAIRKSDSVSSSSEGSTETLAKGLKNDVSTPSFSWKNVSRWRRSAEPPVRSTRSGALPPCCER